MGNRRRPTNPDAASTFMSQPVEGVVGDDVLVACIALLPHLGASDYEGRYSEDGKPVVWMAIATFPTGAHEVAAALTPQHAAYRLLERLVDGGLCLHCHRPTSITLDLDEQLAAQVICWYQYDPELKRFRRSCEGDT